MISTDLLRDFSHLLLKYGASLDDIISMVYTQDELNPITGKYKKYFILIKVIRDIDKFPEGFSYKVRYKIDLSGNRIPQGKATYTTKTASIDEAVKLGFENRLDILKDYALNIDKPKSGKMFYKMLIEYYEKGSKYLEDDTVNNKREIVHKARIEAQTFIKGSFIPYLREKKICDINEITVSVYSGFKIYLQARGIKDKTINNRLNFLIRIFDYHLRNGLIKKLPYTKGTALLRLNGKQEKDDAEVLPVEKLKGIYPHKTLIDPIKLIQFINPFVETKDFEKLNYKEQQIIFSDYIQPFTLGVLGLNTGMRNSEIARIKREDFIGVQEKELFLLKVWNNKTDYFNKTSESKYRKIPLHAYTIEAVKLYIKRKEEIYGNINDTDFIFGRAMQNNDSGDIDGYLHPKIFDKAVLLFLKLIKHKENLTDFFLTVDDLMKLNEYEALQVELKEMKDTGKGISFYSFRKTFRTMLGLSNDLAEYYMGHKLGDNSKTTYIQVNSLDNGLFVDEYAEPVIAMLNKYIFYSKDEIMEIEKRKSGNIENRIEIYNERLSQEVSLQEIYEEYSIIEGIDGLEKNTKISEDSGYFDRI